MTFSNTKSIREGTNDIYIDDIKIDIVNKIKMLGLIINNKLNWSAHIKYICSKISKNIGIMKKVKNKLEKRLLLNLYYMLIYPYLTYCNTIWGRAPNVYLDKTYILQKTIVRIISHVGFFVHTEPLFSTLQIMNIYQINKYMCCILMFKHNKAILPTLINDVFVLSPMTHKYCTRQKFAYKIPFCRTKCRQLSLAYVGPKIWNTLILDNS